MNSDYKKEINLFFSLPSVDCWFPTRKILQLQSGCEYLCRYCPVNWKTEKKLLYNPIHKKNPEDLKKDFSLLKKKEIIGLGAGYIDPFPPREALEKEEGKQYLKNLTFLLGKLLHHGHHLLIMTKNPQGLLDVLLKNKKDFLFSQITIVCSIAFAGSHDKNFTLLEPGLPSIEERWQCLNKLKKLGATTGSAYIPIIPHINDDLGAIEKNLLHGKKAGIDFCLFGELNEKAKSYLSRGKWIKTETKMNKAKIEKFFIEKLKEMKIFPLPPFSVYQKFLSPRDLSIVYLKQLYLYQNWLGKNKPYLLRAAISLEKIGDNFFESFFTGIKKETNSLCEINEIGFKTENLLKTLIFQKKTTNLDNCSKFFR